MPPFDFDDDEIVAEPVAPDVTYGHVYGWRGYGLSGNTLVGPVTGTVLDFDQPAQCAHGGAIRAGGWTFTRGGIVNTGSPIVHHPPEPGCSCGYYVFSTLREYFAQSCDREHNFHILAYIQAWGRIVLHDSGFRAQYIRPRYLFLPLNAWNAIGARALERRYHVPVYRYRHVWNLAVPPRDRLTPLPLSGFAQPAALPPAIPRSEVPRELLQDYEPESEPE